MVRFLAHPVYLFHAKCYSYIRQIKRVNFLEFDNAIDSVLCLVRCEWLCWLSRRMLSCVCAKGNKRRRSSCLTCRPPVRQDHMCLVVLLALHPCPASVDILCVHGSPTRAETRRSSSHLKYETVVILYQRTPLRHSKMRSCHNRTWLSDTCLRSRKSISKPNFDNISQSTAEIKVLFGIR